MRYLSTEVIKIRLSPLTMSKTLKRNKQHFDNFLLEIKTFKMKDKFIICILDCLAILKD